MNPNDSEIIISSSGVTFAGPDATNFFRALALAQSLSMYAKFKMVPTRGVTGTMLLKWAVDYTGHAYKRGQHELAAQEVRVWIETMKAAMPVTLEVEQ